MRGRRATTPEVVTVTGSSFDKYNPPEVHTAITRFDITRYQLDGWQICDFGSDIVAIRELPILDGDIGLLTVLSPENFARAEAKQPHNGGGRVKGYIFLGEQWRALDLDDLCGHDNRYHSGRELMAALAMVQLQIRQRANTQLEFRDRAFRRSKSQAPTPQKYRDARTDSHEHAG
jgi:hypothetical protein